MSYRNGFSSNHEDIFQQTFLLHKTLVAVMTILVLIWIEQNLISNNKGMANEINISRTALARKCIDSFLNRVVLPIYCPSEFGAPLAIN